MTLMKIIIIAAQTPLAKKRSHPWESMSKIFMPMGQLTDQKLSVDFQKYSLWD